MSFLANLKGATAEFFSPGYKKLPWIRLKIGMFLSRLTVRLIGRDAIGYSRMQKRQYELAASVATAKPGSLKGDTVAAVHWDVQNNWEPYKKYIFDLAPSDSSWIAIEFGCGPGRNIGKWWSRFKRIDGADISKNNLENARIYLSGVLPQDRMPNFFETSGSDLGAAPSGAYDFCFSTICLQHISVWEIRNNIFKDVFRVLTTGGIFAFQMGYGKSEGTVGYNENHYNAGATNGAVDVAVEDPAQVIQDLEKLGFTEVIVNIVEVPNEISSVFEEFIFVSAKKK